MEHSVATVIGDEVEVTVYFDYDPGQEENTGNHALNQT